MDLQLSRKGDYALRAAISLAHHYDDGYRKIREIVAEMALPAQYTPQVLAMLGRAGIATAKAGRDGGYKLTRDPGTISVLEIVEAAEGPLEGGRCTLRGGPCDWEMACPVHHVWVEARVALRKSLSAATLASVAAADDSLRLKAETERRSRDRG